MSENRMIKNAAREMIKGFAGPAMLGTLIFMLISGAAGSLYALSILIIGALNVGYALFFMKIMDEKEVDYNCLFAGFNNFVNALVAGLLYSIFIAIGFILLIVPGIILACGLSMTFIIMAEDSSVSGVDALKKSWEMMKGHKWDYFCLNLRFIGWLLLSILTFGILALWVNGWMQISYINFYRKLKYGQY